jgi:hypothetical protein
VSDLQELPGGFGLGKKICQEVGVGDLQELPGGLRLGNKICQVVGG